MTSFFDEIARNRMKSMLLLLVFGALFAIILFFGIALIGGGPGAFTLGIIIVIAYALFTYFSGDKLVLMVSRAQPADESQYKTLYADVQGMASAMQIRTPKIYVIQDPSPNAFATGRRSSPSIAFTTGILSMMKREELEGVISHELSHIQDNDIQVMTIAIAFAGAIGLIAAYMRNILFWGFGFGNNRRGNAGPILIVAFAIGLLAPLFALLIRLAISRRREYMADANGARVTRNPAELASALKKIENFMSGPRAQPVMHANEVTSSLYFTNPFKANSLLNLFSTHPPIEDRIKKLEAMY